MVAYNSAYATDVLTTTFEKRAKKIEDNVFNTNAFLFWLKKKNMVKMDGGLVIEYPVEYAKNNTVDSYEGYDPFDITPQDTATMAVYRWAQWGGSVIINSREENQNSGEAGVIKLLQHKEDSLVSSITEYLGEKLITSNGTGNSGKDPYGLAYFIGNDTSGPNHGTVGGIDSSGGNATWWRPRSRWGSDGSGTDEELTKANLDKVYLECSRGTGGGPDLELTTEDLFLKYESLLFANIRYEDVDTANAGFANLKHKGAVVMHDVYVPSKCWYMINSKFLFLVGHQNDWFKMHPFIAFPDKDAKVALHTSMGNLVCTARRKQGMLASQVLTSGS